MVYRFGVFEFDSDTKELRKNGRAAAIEPQPAKALALLVSRAGDVVSREELRDAVWGKDTHVDFDRGLAYCVSQVRTALGDSGDNPRFVQTILFGIEPVSPGSFGLPVVCLMTVSLLATWAPLRRAIRVDPAEALRTE